MSDLSAIRERAEQGYESGVLAVEDIATLLALLDSTIKKRDALAAQLEEHQQIFFSHAVIIGNEAI